MHPAEVLALALEARGSVPQQVPERHYLEPAAKPEKALVAAAVGAAAAGVLLWAGSRYRQRA